MTSFSSRRVRIFRDSFETPWGFRLQGGKDLDYPLTVQRVFSNSPAEGELQRGDIILSINGRDAGSLTHKQAQDQIKFGGGQIELVVNRPPSGVQIKPYNPRSPTRAPATHPLSGATTAPVVIPVRRQSEPKMQSPHAIAGHQPKKITMNKFGGGTTTFGSSYQPPRGFVPKPSPYSEQYTPQPSMQQRDMYDSAPPSQAYSPQQYQQYQPPPQQQYQSPPQQQYQPPPQQYQPPPQQQAYEPPPSHPGMQQPDYVRSGDPVEEEEYEYIPVSQRKKQFVNSPSGPSRIRPKKKLVMNTAASGYASFGTDYNKTPTGTPQSAQPRPPPPPQKPQRPINAAPDDALQTRDLIDANAPWNQTLRSSGGPRPWEHEGGDYMMPSQREQMQSSPKPKGPPKQPKPQVVKVAQPQQPAPAQSKITIRSVSNEAPDEDKTGPSVVHLQYNSPIGLYSDANVQNTFNAQTQGRPASQTQSTATRPQGQGQGQGQQGQQGDRDWNQSYVYRMLHEQSSSQRQVYPPQQQQQSQPVVSQTYQSNQKSWTNEGDDEIGISEF